MTTMLAPDSLVPDHEVIPAAAMWIEQLLLGRLATIVAVLAVASVGLLMLQGRLAWRSGVRVVLGCFILFGAPLIARGLIHAVQGAERLDSPPAQAQPMVRPRRPPNADPYAGASLPG